MTQEIRTNDGARAVLACGSLSGDLLPSSIAVEAAEAIPPTGSACLLVLCPADRDELNQLLSNRKESSWASTRPAIVVAEFADVLAPPEGGGLITSAGTAAMALKAAATLSLFLRRDDLGCMLLCSTVLGSLLPLFVHNLNNLMHGVVGNLDLAVLFAEDREKSMTKVESAQQATAKIGEFVSGMGRLSMMQSDELRGPWLEPILEMAEMAAGRAVNFSHHPHDGRPSSPSCATRTILTGLLGAALLAVRGCGEVSLRESRESGRFAFEVRWERAAQQTGRPDRSSEVAALLCSALLLSAANDGCCGIGRWDGTSGRAALTVFE